MRGAFAQASFHIKLLAGMLAALWMCAPAARAQDWTAPARELAGQLRQQIPPPARLAWSVQNRSTLTEDQLAPIRRAISSELRSAGYRPGPPSVAAAQARITISEDFQYYLWVAQIQHEELNWVIMVTLPIARLTRATPPVTSSLALSRKLLLRREEPILDLAMIPATGLTASRLLVLGPASLAVYEASGAAWQVAQTVPLVIASGPPRDLRGRLATRPDGAFEADLPGERCTGSVNLLANLECHVSDEPWPLVETVAGVATAHFVPDRNYFSGPVVLPNQSPLPSPDFYSAVPLESGQEFPWLVAATDGQVKLLNAHGEVAIFRGWGNQLAALQSPCGSGPLVLATRSSDFAEPDAVQVFQIRSRTAEAAGVPAEFSGPVTVLHASSEEGTAFAVVRAAPTGLYEAYRLSITCSD